MKQKPCVQLEHGHKRNIFLNVQKLYVERSSKEDAKTHTISRGEPECV